MLSNHRPSILQRKLKPPSLNNVENGEKEYLEQQAYWQAKSERARATEERFRRSIYPDAQSKHIDQANIKEVMDRQLREVQERRVAEDAEKRGSWVPEEMTADHPWAHRTDVQIQDHMAAIQRRIAQEAALDNLQLVRSRREKEARERDLQNHKERAELQSEETWWNRGAASDRWLPPELRVRPGYGRVHVESHGGSEPPFALAESGKKEHKEDQAAQLRVPAAVNVQHGEKSYPWTWQEAKDPKAYATGEKVSGKGTGAPAEVDVKVYPWNWQEPSPSSVRSQVQTKPNSSPKPYPWTWEA